MARAVPVERPGRSLIAVDSRENGRRGSDCRVLKTLLLKALAIKEGKEMGYWLEGKGISKGMCVRNRSDTRVGLDADGTDPVEEGNE